MYFNEGIAHTDIVNIEMLHIEEHSSIVFRTSESSNSLYFTSHIIIGYTCSHLLVLMLFSMISVYKITKSLST